MKRNIEFNVSKTVQDSGSMSGNTDRKSTSASNCCTVLHADAPQ